MPHAYISGSASAEAQAPADRASAILLHPSQQAALRMKEQGGGSITFLNSNTAYRAIPNRAAYSASKGGINSLSKALAIDLGKYGIRSNVVLPGTIKTERWVEMGGIGILHTSAEDTIRQLKELNYK